MIMWCNLLRPQSAGRTIFPIYQRFRTVRSISHENFDSRRLSIHFFKTHKSLNRHQIPLRRISTEFRKPVVQELRKLLSIAKPQKWQLTGAILLLSISSTITISVPFCIGKLIDIMTLSTTEELKDKLITVCAILIAVFTLGGLANFGRVYLINYSSHQIVNTLRKRVYRSILSQEAAFFDRASTGELVNRLSADTSRVGMSVTNNISDGLRNAFSLVGASCLMVYSSPLLACLGLITVAPVAVIATVAGKYLKKTSQSVQDALADATQIAEERISNIRTVQAFARLEHENLIYDKKISFILHHAFKESVGQAVFFGLSGFSGNLIILSVLYYGGLMVNTNEMTIGGLSSFLLYAAYVGISIGGLSSFYTELMRGLGASTRLWELIDRQPLISYQGGITLPNFRGHLSLSDVHFAYPSRPDSEVFSGLNLEIPAGSTCALVGSSGCGKSTIGSLLLRLYDCQKGSITFDGTDVKSLNVEWLRNNIGIVSQDPVLFSFSIGENLLYGSSEDVSDSLLEEVLQQANALEFVKAFKDGLRTVVGERGLTLSGGQRQRIAIARALLKNPKILILDEATSALDSVSEFYIQRALEELMRDRTVIMIAHRLSTVRSADEIVVLKSGKVIEKGKYNDLLQQKGPFYRLVQLQSLKS